MSDPNEGNNNPAEIKIQLLTDQLEKAKTDISKLEGKLKAAELARDQMAEVLDQQNRTTQFKEIRKHIDPKKLTDQELMALDSADINELYKFTKLLKQSGASVKPDSTEDNFDPRQGLTVGDLFLSQTKRKG